MKELILLTIYMTVILAANDCSVSVAQFRSRNKFIKTLWTDTPDANGYGSDGSFTSWMAY